MRSAVFALAVLVALVLPALAANEHGIALPGYAGAPLAPTRSANTLFFDDMESGEGDWTHIDNNTLAPAQFHLDTYMAYEGTYSWWCGSFDYDANGGYGNNWIEFLHVPDLDLSTATYPILTYAYRAHSEPAYDFTYVQVDQSGTTVNLAAYDGLHSWTDIGVYGFNLTGYDITPLQARFLFMSDGAWSDEDGMWTSAGGAFMCDNIKVYDYYSGYVYFFDDCEGGGLCTPSVPTGGDLWHIVERPCASTSGTHCWWVGDDADTTHIPGYLDNALISPAIDVTGLTDVRIFFSFHTDVPAYQGDWWSFEVSPDGGATWYWDSSWWGDWATCATWSTYGWGGIEMAPYLPGSAVRFRVKMATDEGGSGPGQTGAAGITLDDFMVVDVSGTPDTHTVPGDFATIREALQIAMPHDTIEVGDGVYTEALRVYRADISLVAGSTPIIDLGKTSTSDPAVGNCVYFSYYADNGVLDGFTLRHGDNGVAAYTSNVTIQNCEIYDNFGDGSSAYNVGNGIYTNGSNHSEFLNNQVYGNSDRGIYASGDSLLIDGNVIHDNGSASSTYSHGILLAHSLGSMISDNFIFGHPDYSGTRQCAVWEYGDTNLDEVECGSNIYTGNVVYDNEYSIVFEGTYDSPSTANLNSFFSNSEGMTNVTASSVMDATNSWWGAVSGPFASGNPSGTGDTIYGSITYAPWLTAPVPTLTEVYVDDDYYDGGSNDGHAWGYNAFDNIQAGINAVGAGTVYVAAGTYAERLTLSEGTDVRGAQYGVDPTLGGRTDPAAESVVDITGLGTPSPNVAVELTSGAAGASFSGFTVIGSPTFHNADESVFRAWCGDLTIEDNIVDGYYGVIHKGGSNVSVSRNSMTVNKNGITLQPGTYDGFTIEGNLVVRGAAPAGDASATYATGATNLTFTDNDFSGFSDGNGVGGSNLGNVTISGNDLSDCRKGVNIWGNTTAVAVLANDILNCSNAGVNIKGQDLNVSGNVFTGCDVGFDVGVHTLSTERVAASDNDFSGCVTLGMKVDPGVAETVDASGNYWGSTDPTTVKASANAGLDIDYTPWLGGGTAQNPGYSGDCSTLYVDDDSEQVGTDGRIQEAAGLVDGSTIHIAGGTYPGSLVFGAAWDKDGVVFDGDDSDPPELTGGIRFLQSAQIDGITFRDLTLKGVAAGGNAMIDFDNTGAVNDLVIDRCLLDGELVSDRNGLTGNLLGQSLTVTDTEIKDVLGWSLMDFDSASDYLPYGGNGLPLTTVTFSGNHVHECNGSIALRGHYTSRTTVANIYDNTFENIGGNGGEQGQQWAALEVNHCEVAHMCGNTVTGVSEGQWGEGQAFQLWDVGTLNFENNSVTDNHQGVFFFGGSAGGDYGGPYAIPSGGLHYSSFVGNTQYGVSVDPNCTGGPLDAEMNWWGDESGPATSKGTGDKALGNVDYDPWIGKAGTGNVVCDPDPDYLSIGDQLAEIDVNYLGGGGGMMYGYTVKVSWNPLLVTTTKDDVTQGTLLSDVGGTFWNVRSTGASELTIDCILLGAQDGTAGPGTMFSIDFDAVVPVGYGVSAVDITVDRIRDKDNNTLSGFFADDGEIIVDTTAPSVTAVHVANDDPDVTDDWVKNGDPVTVTATVTDAHPAFGEGDIKANLTGLGGAADAAPDPGSYDGTTATWTIAAAACSPANGTITVTVTAVDAHGNTGSGSDTIEADNILPSAVTSFEASPGHGKCDLTWTNGTDDNLAGVAVRRYAEPGEYPQYPWHVANYPSTAKYPTDKSSGAGVYDDTGESFADDTMTGRNIYYYQAFCYDEARNYGPADPGARDLATNYWLGDIADEWGSWGYDGVVNDDDILKLGLAYWTSDPMGYPGDAECDVGPTVHPDYGRLGLPKPDNAVEFEDAMVFAMNYGVVAPRVVPFLPEPYDPAPLALALGGTESRGDEIEVALSLEGNSGEVKGLSASLAFDATELQFLSARLADGMQSPIGEMFFMHRAGSERVELDAVVLGTGVTIGGCGDVAVLTFRALSESYSLEVESARVRGTENEELMVKLGDYQSTEDAPMVFRLVGNTPNPFNPITKIAYHVPHESYVSIRVYDVTGRLVTTLVDGVSEPGRHVAVWNGTNDRGESVGSGVYFCTMEAPDFHESRKMTLLK